MERSGQDRLTPEVMGRAFDAHRRRLLATAARTGFVSEREDVVQDVFVDLCASPGRFDPERGSLRALLVTKTRSRAIDVARAEAARDTRQSRWEADRRSAGPDVASRAVGEVTAAAVRAALAAMPASMREPLTLAYYGDRSYREVARLIGVAEGTVKSRIRAGLARLREELTAAGLHPVDVGA